MNRVLAVIGANYGDEGKGHIVDFLSNSNTVVVRYNGGAQAGHTVVTSDGRRHVFHHFGSGTLRGARTFLSRFFLVNPTVFVDELTEIIPLTQPTMPVVYVDPEAWITTPYDVMLNRAIEDERGSGRHGSCGMGINETVTRCKQRPEFAVTTLDLHNWEMLKKKLIAIRDEYVPQRMEELHLEKLPHKLLSEDQLLLAFMYDCEKFRKFTTMTSWCEFMETCSFFDVLFEGAQGLRLDERNGLFPYVTRSRTGLPNVLELMEDGGITKPIDVYYVTRPYITRHGVGPLELEMAEPPMPHLFEDKTNVPNDYQGTLRFGAMNIESFLEPIYKDLEAAMRAGVMARPHLALTCIDQIDDAEFEPWFLKTIRERLYLYGRIGCDAPNHAVEERFEDDENAAA